MATTYEEILNLFRENDLQIKELLRSQQETDRKFQETDRNIKELLDAQKDTNRKLQDTDRKLNQLEKPFTSQWGKLMESLVEGDLVNLLIQRGIPIADTTTRLKGKRPDGSNYEFDIIAHNGEEMFLISPTHPRWLTGVTLRIPEPSG